MPPHPPRPAAVVAAAVVAGVVVVAVVVVGAASAVAVVMAASVAVVSWLVAWIGYWRERDMQWVAALAQQVAAVHHSSLQFHVILLHPSADLKHLHLQVYQLLVEDLMQLVA
jgi:hypothetical protein